jgi:thymidylate synthase
MYGAYYRDFDAVWNEAVNLLIKKGKLVPVTRWQGIDVSDDPNRITHELFDWSFSYKMPQTVEELQRQIKPNLPWSDEHFAERVGGVPSNPGEAYKNWPFFQRQKNNDRHRDDEGAHSHSYQERMWTPALQGIRYEYGNLGDVLDLLEREPLTRQAYLPLFFPEDTGTKFRGRVPCTLGYHFMLRNGELNIFYPIRACDLFRHFQDDVYMACRLNLWVLDQLRQRDPDTWNEVKPGKLRMHIVSLHVFAVEAPILEKKLRR